MRLKFIYLPTHAVCKLKIIYIDNYILMNLFIESRTTCKFSHVCQSFKKILKSKTCHRKSLSHYLIYGLFMP